MASKYRVYCKKGVCSSCRYNILLGFDYSVSKLVRYSKLVGCMWRNKLLSIEYDEELYVIRDKEVRFYPMNFLKYFSNQSFVSGYDNYFFKILERDGIIGGCSLWRDEASRHSGLSRFLRSKYFSLLCKSLYYVLKMKGIKVDISLKITGYESDFSVLVKVPPYLGRSYLDIDVLSCWYGHDERVLSLAVLEGFIYGLDNEEKYFLLTKDNRDKYLNNLVKEYYSDLEIDSVEKMVEVASKLNMLLNFVLC